MQKQNIIVTRHAALVAYLLERGYIKPGSYDVIPHIYPEQARGRHIIGNVPLHVAAVAASVTNIPLNIPFEMRGRELTLEEIRKYAMPAKTYFVREM